MDRIKIKTTGNKLRQIVWLAVDATEKHHPNKRMENTRLIPVILGSDISYLKHFVYTHDPRRRIGIVLD